jgi:hypothetical protein
MFVTIDTIKTYTSKMFLLLKAKGKKTSTVTHSEFNFCMLFVSVKSSHLMKRKKEKDEQISKSCVEEDVNH